MYHFILRMQQKGTMPGLPWLRLHARNAEGPHLIPGQGSRACMPQLKVDVSCAARKIRDPACCN